MVKIITYKLRNNMFYEIKKVKENTYILKSNYNLLTQVNGLIDLLESNNFNFLIGDYDLTLLENDKTKIKNFIDGCTLV